jgi:hypothetical protein
MPVEDNVDHKIIPEIAADAGAQDPSYNFFVHFPASITLGKS